MTSSTNAPKSVNISLSHTRTHSITKSNGNDEDDTMSGYRNGATSRIDVDNLPVRRDDNLNATGGALTAKQAEQAAEIDRRGRARRIAVPTEDGRIRARLRELGEPVTLFGEDVGDRRNRLRYLLSMREDAASAEVEDQEDRPADREYYTDGSDALLSARRAIAAFSLSRAAKRIAQQQASHATTPLGTVVARRKALDGVLRGVEVEGSVVAGARAVGVGRFSPDGTHIATGSWAAELNIFTTHQNNLAHRYTLTTPHTSTLSALVWHPHAPPLTDHTHTHVMQLATAGADGSIALWSDQSIQQSREPAGRLVGHSGRVSRLAMHPSGGFLASASYDGTWRLWDLQRGASLLVQDGHAREVSTVAIGQGDGSLCASAGYDHLARVWDLRTGKTVLILEGHAKPIHAADWNPHSPNLLATASADDTVKIWDIRHPRKPPHTLPAHRSLVSDCRWAPATSSYTARTHTQDHDSMDTREVGGVRVPEVEVIDLEEPDEQEVIRPGSFLATSGYDGRINLWSTGDWSLVASLGGHADDKIMSVDISPASSSVANSPTVALCSTGWDRTLRLWSS